MLQHAVRNQITVLNTTIAHIENIETIIDRNEKLLQRQIMRYLDREEIYNGSNTRRRKYNRISYILYIQKGSMHPKLMPTDEITHN